MNEEGLAFRIALLEAGLTFPDNSIYKKEVEPFIPRFDLDLPDGRITLVIPRPDRIEKLLELADTHSPFREAPLLRHLTVSRAYLYGPRVLWVSGAYPVPDTSVRFSDWFEEVKQNSVPLYKDILGFPP